MVVRSEPKTSPSKVMQVIKSICAREFFKLHPEIRKQYFCGGKLWTQSYFVETIGNANEDVIRAYVQNQLKVMNENEANDQQLGLFWNPVARGRVVYRANGYPQKNTQILTMLRPRLHSILLDITASIGLINIAVACHQIKQRQSTTLSLIPWPVLLDH